MCETQPRSYSENMEQMQLTHMLRKHSQLCTVMPMCVFVAHVLYLQCMLGPRARTVAMLIKEMLC